jgi:hypothetical protein
MDPRIDALGQLAAAKRIELTTRLGTEVTSDSERALVTLISIQKLDELISLLITVSPLFP